MAKITGDGLVLRIYFWKANLFYFILKSVNFVQHRYGNGHQMTSSKKRYESLNQTDY